MPRRPSPSVLALGIALFLGLAGSSMQWGRIDGRTPKGPLQRAVTKGDLTAVRKLLDEGEKPDERTRGGMTALGLAVELDRWRIADLLLERGGDPNARVYGMSLLRECALSGDWDGFDWLTDRGAQPDAAAEALALRRPPPDANYRPFPR